MGEFWILFDANRSFQRVTSTESHFEGKEYLKIVLRHSKRTEGLSGEKNRVEKDEVATVEETGFQTCVARKGKRLPPLFSRCLGTSLDEIFCGRWKQELKNELRPHATT